MAGLLHSGCPQVIQGPSCMYPSGPNSDQHMWPGQADGSAPTSPGPPNTLAPRLLSCRCAWSFQITETHEAVFPVLYLCLGVFGHSQWNFNLVIHYVVPRCVILTLPSSLRRFHFPPEKIFFWNYRTVLQIKVEYPEIPSQKQILVNWLVADGYLRFWNFEIWRVLERIWILEVSPFLKTSSTLPFSTQLSTVYFQHFMFFFFFFLCECIVALNASVICRMCFSPGSGFQFCSNSIITFPAVSVFIKIWVYQQSRHDHSGLV